MRVYDSLLVINQNITLKQLYSLQDRTHIQRVVCLTTHKLFPYEEQVIRSIFVESEFVTFSDLLTEEDMCQCDEEAESLLLNQGSQLGSKRIQLFQSFSLRAKNRMVYQKILRLYRVNSIFYASGLGIDATYWSKTAIQIADIQDSRKIDLRVLYYNSKSILLKLLHVLFKIIIRNRLKVYVIEHENHIYAFISSLKRLRLNNYTYINTLEINCRNIVKPKKLSSFIQGKMRDLLDKKIFFCTTIHDYNTNQELSNQELLVFVDGLHPSNYPYSYLHGYGNNIFVPRTMFDNSWFIQQGKKTMKPPGFIEPEFFKSCSFFTELNILVALNHAGDWTSLINRSDTDRLVLLIADIASQFPQAIFRIRPHPTMNHPQHEGINSTNRIHDFVATCKLKNLEVSTIELHHDLKWCTICVSEYSQVLLDAWRIGKAGVSVNLTKRRSFMQDYASLGFLHANSSEDFIKVINQVSDHPGLIQEQQSRAVSLYNQELSNWLFFTEMYT